MTNFTYVAVLTKSLKVEMLILILTFLSETQNLQLIILLIYFDCVPSWMDKICPYM